jgi:hypothetical protein
MLKNWRTTVPLVVSALAWDSALFPWLEQSQSLDWALALMSA